MPSMLSFSRRKALYAAIMRRNGIKGHIRFHPMPPLRSESDAGTMSAPSTAPDTGADKPRTPIMAGQGSANSSQPQLVTLQRAPFAVRVLNHLTAGATTTPT